MQLTLWKETEKAQKYEIQHNYVVSIGRNQVNFSFLEFNSNGFTWGTPHDRRLSQQKCLDDLENVEAVVESKRVATTKTCQLFFCE